MCVAQVMQGSSHILLLINSVAKPPWSEKTEKRELKEAGPEAEGAIIPLAARAQRDIVHIGREKEAPFWEMTQLDKDPATISSKRLPPRENPRSLQRVGRLPEGRGKRRP